MRHWDTLATLLAAEKGRMKEVNELKRVLEGENSPQAKRAKARRKIAENYTYREPKRKKSPPLDLLAACKAALLLLETYMDKDDFATEATIDDIRDAIERAEKV